VIGRPGVSVFDVQPCCIRPDGLLFISITHVAGWASPFTTFKMIPARGALNLNSFTVPESVMVFSASNLAKYLFSSTTTFVSPSLASKRSASFEGYLLLLLGDPSQGTLPVTGDRQEQVIFHHVGPIRRLRPVQHPRREPNQRSCAW
jgi:hypothetical protein